MCEVEKEQKFKASLSHSDPVTKQSGTVVSSSGFGCRRMAVSFYCALLAGIPALWETNAALLHLSACLPAGRYSGLAGLQSNWSSLCSGGAKKTTLTVQLWILDPMCLLSVVVCDEIGS